MFILSWNVSGGIYIQHHGRETNGPPPKVSDLILRTREDATFSWKMNFTDVFI